MYSFRGVSGERIKKEGRGNSRRFRHGTMRVIASLLAAFVLLQSLPLQAYAEDGVTSAAGENLQGGENAGPNGQNTQTGQENAGNPEGTSNGQGNTGNPAGNTTGQENTGNPAGNATGQENTGNPAGNTNGQENTVTPAGNTNGQENTSNADGGNEGDGENGTNALRSLPLEKTEAELNAKGTEEKQEGSEAENQGSESVNYDEIRLEEYRAILEEAYAVEGKTPTDTQLFNEAIWALGDDGGTIYVPAKDYSIQTVYYDEDNQVYRDYGIRIEFKNNIHIEMDPGTTLVAEQVDNYSGLDPVIYVAHSDNVSITGGKIVGNRDRRTPVAGAVDESGMGIIAYGVSNLHIKEVGIMDCWGDGITLAPYLSKDANDELFARPCENVNIIGCGIHNNRRNNIAITGAEHVQIDHCDIYDANGTAPECGILIEPGIFNNQYLNTYVICKDIKISNTRISSYDGQSAVTQGSQKRQNLTFCTYLIMKAEQDWIDQNSQVKTSHSSENIVIENCTFHGDMGNYSGQNLIIKDSEVTGVIEYHGTGPLEVNSSEGNEYRFALHPYTDNPNLKVERTEILYELEGKRVATQVIERGKTTKQPEIAVPEGYTLAGWNYKGSEEVFDFSQPLNSGSIELVADLKADWEQSATYTVTFDLNDGDEGNVIPEQKVKEGDYATRPDEPAKDGHYFLGWFLGGSNTEYDFENTPVKQDITLFARWEPFAATVHTVTFDLGGGTFTLDESEAEYFHEENGVWVQHVEDGGYVYLPLNDPKMEDYEFLHWSLLASSDEAYGAEEPVTDSFTLYAQWEHVAQQTHTVTFDTDGGNTVENQQVTDLSTAKKPDDPTKTGYTFKGWTVAGGDGTAYDFKTPVTGDLTLTAQWEINKYTVTFNLDGGNGTIDDQTVEYLGTVTEPTGKPDRAGHMFKHWSATQNGAAYDFITTPVTKDITLYAVWQIKTYTVTFDVNGGESTVGTKTVNHGQPVADPGTPVRTGYTFKGWKTTADGSGSTYDFSTPVTGDLTLIAQWEINKYTVKFDADNGSAVVSQTVEHGTHVTEPTAPSKEGHTFAGWLWNGGTFIFDETPVTQDMVLTATWNVNTYTVTFLQDEGDTESFDVQTVKYNETATYPKPAPTKEDHTFTEWQLNGKSYDFSAKVTQDITLVAAWTRNPVYYTVTFRTDDTDQGVHDTKTALEDTAVKKPTDPSKEGYTFKYWSTEQGGAAYDFATPVNAPLTLYAVWKINTYTVQFELDGGSVNGKETVDSQTVDYLETITAPTDEPTKTGYTFRHWSTTQNGETPYEFATPVKAGITLYAVWTVNEYTVVFDLDGGNGTFADQPVKYLGKVTEPTGKPEREGYTFLRWSAKQNGAEYDFTTQVTDNITLYAVWQINKYTVAFDSDNGSAVVSQEVTYNSMVPKPADPEKEGYMFLGWQLNGSNFDFETMPVKANITLTATWQIKTYTVTFDVNNGEPQVEAKRVDHGQTVADPGTPVRTGYTFKGWKATGGNGSAYDFNTAVTGDLTLIAQWEINKYTVKFDLNGGNGTIDPQEVEYLKTATEPQKKPEKKGHTFAGWATSDGTAYTFNEQVTSDITLKAQWTANTYQVSFDLDGGTVTDAYATQDVTFGSTAKKPVNPEKTGHTFHTWMLGEKEYDFGTAVEDHITLVAAWTKNTVYYDVTFMSDENTHGTARPEENTTVTQPATNPSKEGYTFKYWSTEQGGAAYDFATPVNAPLTLYAVWEINTYSVKFNLDGGLVNGSKTVDPQTVNYLEKATAPQKPTKAGHTFKHWSATQNGETPYDFNTQVKADITLYAVWDVNKYTVWFDLDGGNGTIEDQKIDYQKLAMEPATDPEKTGYTFKHWSATQDGTTAYHFETPVTENITLYAVWEINTYTVTFDADGGSAVASKRVTYQDTVTKPADPEKEGYQFTGWTLNGNVFDFDTTPVEANITLTAAWQIKTYTVTFDVNDGVTQVEAKRVDHGRTVADPGTPVRTGYTFKGWKTTDGSGSAYDFRTAVTGDLILKAEWEINKYTVTFDLNGGSGTIDPQKVEYLGTATEPQKEPEKKGHTFAGWVTEDGTAYAAYAFSEPVTSDITLKAQWTANTYKVSFNLNGGTDTDAYAPQDVTFGTQARMPETPAKEGYTFRTWTLNGADFSFGTAIEEDITLVADWTKDKVYYQVTFKSEEGDKVYRTDAVLEETQLTEPEDPVKEGHTFKHWSETQNGTAYDFATSVNAPLTLYAVWEINTYMVKFDLDGGSGTFADRTVEYLGKVTEPTDEPTKTGHTFRHWSTTQSGEAYEFATQVKADITLYAVWSVNTYTVKFDVNDGNGTIDDQKIEYQKTATEPAAPTKTGHKFMGWKLPDGQGKPGDQVYDFATPVTGDITLKAEWKKIYKIQVAEVKVNDGENAKDVKPEDITKNAKETIDSDDTIANEVVEMKVEPRQLSQNAHKGEVFDRWLIKGSNGENLTNVNLEFLTAEDAETLQFKMPEADIIVTAVYRVEYRFLENALDGIENNERPLQGDKLSTQFTEGDDKATFVIGSEFDNFRYLEVDGKPAVRGEHYDASEGSTKIMLHLAKLELIAGEHTIKAVFSKMDSEGNQTLFQEPTAKFDVVKAQPATPSTGGGSGSGGYNPGYYPGYYNGGTPAAGSQAGNAAAGNANALLPGSIATVTIGGNGTANGLTTGTGDTDRAQVLGLHRAGSVQGQSARNGQTGDTFDVTQHVITLLTFLAAAVMLMFFTYVDVGQRVRVGRKRRKSR